VFLSFFGKEETSILSFKCGLKYHGEKKVLKFFLKIMQKEVV